VQYTVYRSTDGGKNWTKFNGGLTKALPFLVRLIREEAAAAPDSFLTFSAPAAVFQSVAGADWSDISGILHWKDPLGAGVGDFVGFTTPTGGSIGLRNLATHPGRAGVYGAVSNKYAYLTTDGGANWNVSKQAKVPGSTLGAYGLSSIAFDPADLTGQTYYMTSKAMSITDDAGSTSQPMPESFGHLYKTSDGGASWISLAARPASAGGLPFVPVGIVKVDPNDPQTLYVGTEIGLYRSIDGGQNFSRFGAGSMPMVDVTDLCITPASKRLSVATFGRGFWQISTDLSTNPAGVKGRGDTNFDLRVDGSDLLDLADAFLGTQVSATYRYQADMVGATNLVDDADLTAMLAKFGGQP
jgi:hypothetical protein